MEIWDAYLPNGILVGCDLVRGKPIPNGLRHLVSEIPVRHTDGDYLLMQRDYRKPNYGRYFEATAGGSALKGEEAKAGRAAEFEIASAAVSREEIGNPVYPPARRELQKHGIACGGHAAHQITCDELDGYDRIYYMDASNARYLRRLFGASAAKCQPLLPRDVADPWYTGDFTATWDDILEGCTKILEECTHE